MAGAASVRMGSRSLRGRRTPWQLVVAPTAVIVALSSADSPATNDWSGGALYLALMSALIGLSTGEIALLDAGRSRSRLPLILASGALSAYYAVCLVVFLAAGQRGEVFTAWFGTPSTTLITLILLVMVSSMASLSGEQVARMIAARAARSRQKLVDGGGVQRRLLPDLPGYEVAGACVPSGDVSGDFFDWQRTPGGLVVTLADVMGKGVGAAMIAATVRASLRLASPRPRMTPAAPCPWWTASSSRTSTSTTPS